MPLISDIVEDSTKYCVIKNGSVTALFIVSNIINSYCFGAPTENVETKDRVHPTQEPLKLLTAEIRKNGDMQRKLQLFIFEWYTKLTFITRSWITTEI